VTIVERFTNRSGVRIRYLDNAPPEPVGLPILFSPGFTDFADEYVETLDFMQPLRVLVVEVRGRGGSESPETGYTAAEHADDLRAVLDEEGIDRFHLMTFSRGTTWGLDLVLAHPARCTSVSIGDYWAREKGFAGDDAVVTEVLASRFRGKQMSERVASHVVRELFGHSQDRDLSGPLAATCLPVLVATGTEPGCILTPATVQEWRDRVPGVEIVTIDGASHDLFRPDRHAYPQAVIDFVTRRTPNA
jgi:pimeloyl-ACP methyl ester carboxylesterase